MWDQENENNMNNMPEFSVDPNEQCWWKQEGQGDVLELDVNVVNKENINPEESMDASSLLPSLPPSVEDDSNHQRYSAKVFIGGIPLGTSERCLRQTFGVFDQCEVNWPNRRAFRDSPPNGYCFIQFRHSEAVRALVNACHTKDDNHFFLLHRSTELVQIRPWCLSDSTYSIYDEWHRFVRMSVFIGGLPRTLKAKSLFELVQSMFGNVIHCSMELEFDSSYPKGAARVIFCHPESYRKAASAGHIEHDWFPNKHYNVEFKPFVYNSIDCEECYNPGVLTEFCVAPGCLKYYCIPCFSLIHSSPHLFSHRKGQSQPRDLPNPCRVELKLEKKEGLSRSQFANIPNITTISESSMSWQSTEDVMNRNLEAQINKFSRPESMYPPINPQPSRMRAFGRPIQMNNQSYRAPFNEGDRYPYHPGNQNNSRFLR